MKDTWSIIILCFNEEGSIKTVIERCLAMGPKLGSDFEVIVVDDGSSDQSREILHLLRNTPKLKLVFHEVNKGIGQALKTGYAHSEMEKVTMVPGDGQFDLEEFLPFAHQQEELFVSFYRVENTTYSLFRNILSLVNRLVNQYLVGIKLRDVNWVKIYPGSRLRQLPLKINSSLVESEICSKLILSGIAPTEVKSKYLPRIAGKSRGASFKIVRKAAIETLKLIGVIWSYRFSAVNKK